jgi:MAPEG family
VRRQSILLSACGILAAVVLCRALVAEIPEPVDSSSVAARVSLTLAWLLPSLALLWAMLLAQMSARFLGARFDPLAGGEGRFLAVNQRVITNTVEHMLVFAPSLLALAARVSGARMPDVIALAIVFAVARVAFWAGYLVTPIGRGPGMAATVAATAMSLGGAMFVWCAPSL